MVEVRFKPADVGTVADGSITNAKIASDAAIVATKLAAIPQSKVTDLETDISTIETSVASKVDGVGTTGDKAITKIGWDSATSEVVIDHA